MFKNEVYSSVGIDACKGKWVAVHISDLGFEVKKFETISDICSRHRAGESCEHSSYGEEPVLPELRHFKVDQAGGRVPS